MLTDANGQSVFVSVSLSQQVQIASSLVVFVMGLAMFVSPDPLIAISAIPLLGIGLFFPLIVGIRTIEREKTMSLQSGALITASLLGLGVIAAIGLISRNATLGQMAITILITAVVITCGVGLVNIRLQTALQFSNAHRNEME